MAFDLDSASKSLREEPTPLPRILPIRRGARSLRWAAPLAAGIAVFVLWPRAGSSAAWAQVAANSRAQPRVHVRTTISGKLISERWQDGSRLAMDAFDESGKLSFRVRVDVRRLTYLGHQSVAWTYPATGQPSESFHSLTFGEGAENLEALLKKEGIREIKPAKPEGDLVRYQLGQTMVARPGREFKLRFDALVEPQSGRIRRVEYIRDNKVKLVDEIDYPSSIPAAKFAPAAPLGVKVVDGGRATQKAQTIIRRGIETRNVAGRKITLRGLLYDGGSLQIVWTGADLPSNGSYPATLDGTQFRVGYGIAALSSHPEKDKARRPAVYNGLPVRGQQYWVRDKVKPRYTVRIPVIKNGRRVGEAVFRDVPVQTIPSVYAMGDALFPLRKKPLTP